MENHLYKKEEVYAIIGAAMEVHNQIGFGLSESVYHEALMIEMAERGIPMESEKQLNFYYKGHLLEKRYFADLVCYGDIIIELKAVNEIIPQYEAQLINYLKIAGLRLGVLINFGSSKLEYKRIVCG